LIGDNEINSLVPCDDELHKAPEKPGLHTQTLGATHVPFPEHEFAPLTPPHTGSWHDTPVYNAGFVHVQVSGAVHVPLPKLQTLGSEDKIPKHIEVSHCEPV
jgi:hypothetical protein